jgi:anti-repressor protein
MQEIIKIETLGNDIKAVSGRVLYEKLGIESRYNDWINKYIKKYDLMENEDYQTLTQKKVTAQGNQSTFNEHIIRLDHAKKICMVTNNEIGNKIRDYFLECEKQITKTLSLEEMTIQVIEGQRERILQLESRNSDLTGVLSTMQTYGDNLLFREFVKVVYSENKIKITEKEFRKMLIEQGYLMKNLYPMAKYIKYFNVNKGVNNGKAWTTTRLTARGQLYFTNKLLKMFDNLK